MTKEKAKSLAFTFDISDGISNNDIAGWISEIAPESEYGNGTVARVLCTYVSNLSTDIDATLNAAANLSTATFNSPTGTGSAVTNVTFNTVTIPSPAISISRLVKEFTIIAGVWEFTG
jgi:hypothetical protein